MVTFPLANLASGPFYLVLIFLNILFLFVLATIVSHTYDKALFVHQYLEALFLMVEALPN
ncbi:hypothetical protein AV940_14705 [Alteromonas sp. Mac2]|nr:hypothetical protein AV939_14955 [Alteromonas sp. Mac1]AMJ91624.1 hypothetical protein AV940_14705 [Alteromonas sp. Mac2]